MKYRPETYFLAAMILFVVVGLPSFWVIASALEARAYNRLTGAHATTWDAMWVELRVQGEPKK